MSVENCLERFYLTIVLTMLTLVTVAHGEGASAKSDPMNWSPPKQPPAFRKLMSDDAYKKGVENIRWHISWERMEGSKRSEWGLDVLSVEEGGALEAADLRVGDQILSVEKTRVLSSEQFCALVASAWKKGKPAALTYQTPRGRVRHLLLKAAKPIEETNANTFSIHAPMHRPADIGGEVRAIWRPVLSYIKRGQRDPRWDNMVAMAALYFRRNPDFAETALWHAVKAGYQTDEVALGLGAHIALRQSRLEEALAFSYFTKQKDVDPAIVWEPAYEAAKRSGYWKMQRRMISKKLKMGNAPYWNKQMDAIAKRIGQFEALPADARTTRLSQRAKQLGQADILPLCSPIGKTSAAALNFQNLKDYQRVNLSEVNRIVALDPGSRSIDMQIQLSLPVKKSHLEKGEQAVLIGFGERSVFQKEPGPSTFGYSNFPSGSPRVNYRLTHQVSGAIVCLALRYGPKGIMSAIYHQDSSLASSEVFLQGVVKEQRGQKAHVRILRMDGFCEIFVNGQRVFFGPVPAKAKAIPFVMTHNSRSSIANWDVRESTRRHESNKVTPDPNYITFRVQAESGKPLLGVTFTMSGTQEKTRAFFQHVPVSDRNGIIRVRMAALWKKFQADQPAELSLLLGKNTSYLYPSVFTIRKSEPVVHVVKVLATGGVFGEVVTPTGEALEHALLTLKRIDENPTELLERRYRRKNTQRILGYGGTYYIYGLIPGTYSLKAEKPLDQLGKAKWHHPKAIEVVIEGGSMAERRLIAGGMFPKKRAMGKGPKVAVKDKVKKPTRPKRPKKPKRPKRPKRPKKPKTPPKPIEPPLPPIEEDEF